MFDGLMRSLGLRHREVELASPIAGYVAPLCTVNDATFSRGMLGEGVAIVPSGDRVVAPADAKVVAVFPTGHAVALRTVDGFDVLVHVGLGTSELSGRHFKVDVAQDQLVSRGDVLIQFDREAIIHEGFDMVVPVLLRNALEYAKIDCLAVGRDVGELDELIIARER